MEPLHDYESKSISELEKVDVDNISLIANKTISKLCETSNLLVFPKVLNHYKDDIDKSQICTLNENTLTMGDLMGFIGINDTQLTIQSRFTNSSEDYFLHYMVQKVFNINLFDLKHSSTKDKVFDFLAYLFPYYLKEALHQGLFKKYTINEYNNANVKGNINIKRHIKQNIPFAGKVAYRVREFSYDNHITQLIRHTIEYIKTSHMARILKSYLNTEEAIYQIVNSTKSYKLQNKNKVISANINPIRHPYFTKYMPLQRLCLQILQHKGLKYGFNNDKIYGLLFSGSWLWEEYLFKSVLEKCEFKHPQNKSNKGGIYLFENNTYKRYPDYIKENFIFDAKYKNINNDNIDRNDMHQIISYMHITNAKIGGFLYPSKDTDNIYCLDASLGTLRGFGGEIHTIGIPIPKNCKNFRDFTDKMQVVEKDLTEKIKNMELSIKK